MELNFHKHIDNHIVKLNISIHAKWLLIYLSALESLNEVNYKFISEKLLVSESRIGTIFRECKKLGYIKKESYFAETEKGKVIKKRYCLCLGL